MTGRLITVLLTLLLAALVVACGDDDDSGEPDEASPTQTGINLTIITVNFDGEACDYSGAAGLLPGTGSLVLVNQGNAPGSVTLWQIGDGKTYRDFQAFYDENPGAAEDEFPEWATVAGTSKGTDVAPSTTFSVSVQLEPGTYAIECPIGDGGALVDEITVQ
jgi:hypothetical protein